MQESAYRVTMYKDNMFAMPSSVENIALAYNKQILGALPALPSVINSGETTLLGQASGMNVYTSYPNAAMNLMNFLVSDEIMKEVYATLGKIPSVKDSSKIPGLSEDAISQGFLAQAANSHPMPGIQEGNYMWDPLRDVWTNIFVEKMSITDAQAKSQTDYEKILSDSGSDAAEK